MNLLKSWIITARPKSQSEPWMAVFYQVAKPLLPTKNKITIHLSLSHLNLFIFPPQIPGKFLEKSQPGGGATSDQGGRGQQGEERMADRRLSAPLAAGTVALLDFY